LGFGFRVLGNSGNVLGNAGTVSGFRVYEHISMSLILYRGSGLGGDNRQAVDIDCVADKSRVYSL